jgi:4-hydroxy-2-oxoheptanedioate aldolase
MNMRPSRLLTKLRNGEIVCGFKLNLTDARAAEIVAMLGFDCIWADLEHTGNNWSVLEEQIRAAKIYDCDVMTRVSRGSYSDYIKPLELDSAGIMVPHVMSAEDARNIVRMTRFHPIGRRPVDGGNTDGAFANIDFLEYIRQSNEQRFVAIQIEDPEPLEELDEIASVDGIDMLFFGPADFSHSIGVPAQFDDPRVVDARKRVAEVARAHGKFAGTVGRTHTMDAIIEMGFQFVNLGADVIGLSAYCKDIMAQFSAKYK